jgi:hypothetical protein
MSKVTDIAEAEAQEAEADEEEEEAEAETVDPDPEVEPAASANLSMDKALAAMEKENVRHAARVQQIMGADFDLVHVCPGCVDFAAGFTLTPPETAPPIKHGEAYEACDRCNGYGIVLTGSLAEHGRTQTCLNCNGQGFVTKPAEPVTLPPMPDARSASPHASLADELRAQGYMVIDPPAQQRAV